jgi:hypothetical protein
MSFDVYFQKFRHGEPASGGGDRMREVLQPYMVCEEPDHHFGLVKYGDGSADVYVDDDHMMAKHITARIRGSSLYKAHVVQGG